MNLERRPRFAILGGQGAIASAEFHRRFVTRFAQRYAVTLDEDYPEILHLSAALPGLGCGGVADELAAQNALAIRLQFCARWGSDLVALPCNSIEPLLASHTELLPCEVLTPWGVAASWLENEHTPTLVLCSQSLREHLSRLKSRGQESDASPKPENGRVVVPPAPICTMVDTIIESVIAGKLSAASTLLRRLLASIEASRPAVTNVLLACTELSCAFTYGTSPAAPRLNVTDTLDLLVDVSVEKLNPHLTQ